jgi:hypothetical protein
MGVCFYRVHALDRIAMLTRKPLCPLWIERRRKFTGGQHLKTHPWTGEKKKAVFNFPKAD